MSERENIIGGNKICNNLRQLKQPPVKFNLLSKFRVLNQKGSFCSVFILISASYSGLFSCSVTSGVIKTEAS